MFFNSIQLVLFCLITLINLIRSISYEWTPFDCNNDNDASEVAKTLRHVVVFENNLYFFFESFVVTMWVPEFINRPDNLDDPEEDNFVLVYEPSRVYYSNMSAFPDIMHRVFDGFQVFEYVEGSGERPDKTETYLFLIENGQYLFKTGKTLGIVDELEKKRDLPLDILFVLDSKR